MAVSSSLCKSAILLGILSMGLVLAAVDVLTCWHWRNPAGLPFHAILLSTDDPGRLVLRSLLLTAPIVGAALCVTLRRRLAGGSEGDLRATLDSIGDAVIATDDQGRITRMNPVAERLTGWRLEAACGRPLSEVFDIRNEDSGEPVETPVAKVLRQGVVVGLANHTVLVGRDGIRLPIADSGAPIREVDGRIRGVVLVFRDQTREREAERAVRRERDFSEALLDTLGALVLVIDREERVVRFNRACERISGRPAADLLGRPPWDVLLPSEEAARVQTSVRRILDGGPPGGGENHWRAKDGSLHLIRWTNSVLPGADGRPEYLIATGLDITGERAAQEALTASEERLRSVIRSSPMGIHLYRLEEDRRLVLSGANPAADLLTGTDTGRLVGLTIEQAFPALQATEIPDRYRQVIERGETWHTRNVQYEDQRIKGAFDVTAFRTGPTSCAVFFDEITERLRSEENLRRSERMFRTYFSLGVIGMGVIGPDLRWVEVNHRLCDLLARRREDLISSPWNDCVHPDDLPAEQIRMQSLLAGEPGAASVERRLLRGDGGDLQAELWMACVRRDGGGAEFIIAHVQDIGERKRNERQLGQLVAVIEQAQEDIILTDPKGVIRYVNPAFERITGYPRSEALGHTPAFLKSGLHPASFYRELWTTIQAGRTWSGRMVNRRRDGRLVEEDATISPIRDPQGRTTAYAALKHDVTERTRLEDQLRQAQKMEAIGRLAGGIAHDFNNMLGGIMGYAEMLNSRLASQPDLLPLTRPIIEAAERAADLTAKLLAFSRKGRTVSRRFDLHSCIASSLSLLAHSIDRRITLVRRFEAEDRHVTGDATLLENAVLNLGLNARDAMPTGGTITIATRNERFDSGHPTALALGLPAGRYVQLAVSDTGTGMTDEVRSRAFEPFFTTKGQGRGTGLGLSSVYGTAKEHGGAVAIESSLGQGTTVRLWLPLTQRTTPAPVPVKPDSGSHPIPQGCILVIEDEPALRTMAEELLRSLGYQTLSAADGAAGVELYARERSRISGVLLDMIMPSMDGREAFRAIRRLDPQARVLICSGYAQDAGLDELRKEGLTGFVQKPYRLAQLAKAVEEMLG